MSTKHSDNRIVRPPVVVVMGHIDHGKSTLLDCIRKSNVTELEVGGITQHISAYEVTHSTSEQGSTSIERTITFLDTPGHEAFSQMRSRGAQVSDIAILVVSAEDGVKTQTLEALKSISEAKLPYIVAINKIDKPGADIERTKNNLLEHEIYLEGLGGTVPYVAISAKTGKGVSELLDLLLLVADIEELTGDVSKNAEGVVIESHIDTKKGISATLIIKDGSLRSGMFVVVGACSAPVRIMENFLGKNIREAQFSSPVLIIGFNKIPQIGAPFISFDTKKEAEKYAAKALDTQKKIKSLKQVAGTNEELQTIPIIIKADVVGTIDAIKHEIEKLDSSRVLIRIIQEGAGAISENDVRSAGGAKHAMIVGFNVPVDSQAKDLAERTGVEVNTFSIIYDLAKWLKKAVEERTPKIEVEEITGQAKILKTFSRTKDKQIVGGKVLSGSLVLGAQVKIIRREEEIGHGKIISIQSQKANVKEIVDGNEFGSQIQSKIEIASGDIIESFMLIEK